METSLYRHYDIDGVLLYVGISLHVMQRLSEHKNHAHWFNNIANVTIQHFPTREDAISSEIKAIQEESPLHNIDHNKQKTFKPIKPTEYERWQITKLNLEREITKMNAVYTSQEIASELDIEHKYIAKCINANLISAIYTRGCIATNGVDRRKWLITGWAFIDFLEYLERTEVAPWTTL